jgi:hypothetical protein
MSYTNSSLLNQKADQFYVTHDEMWASIPYGDAFMVINNGKQIKQFLSLEESIDYIKSKHQKKRKPRKKSSVTIDQFT